MEPHLWNPICEPHLWNPICGTPSVNPICDARSSSEHPRLRPTLHRQHEASLAGVGSAGEAAADPIAASTAALAHAAVDAANHAPQQRLGRSHAEGGRLLRLLAAGNVSLTSELAQSEVLRLASWLEPYHELTEGITRMLAADDTAAATRKSNALVGDIVHVAKQGKPRPLPHSA